VTLRPVWVVVARPVSRDLGEEAMLDGIPLGSARGIVSHSHGEGKGVGELGLDLGFPGIASATVAAPGIGENQRLT
jgi:hypothetical protein